MKSLDTNILLYAANEDCHEHQAALRLLDEALASPHEWIFADQVLFEMYVGLRHPRVFAKPLTAGFCSLYSHCDSVFQQSYQLSEAVSAGCHRQNVLQVFPCGCKFSTCTCL